MENFFCFGCNFYGQLGLGTEEKSPKEFQPPSPNSSIRYVAKNSYKISNWEILRCLLIAHEKNRKSIWRRVPIEIIKVINDFILRK